MKRFHCLIVALFAVAAPWQHKNWQGEVALSAGRYRGPDKGVRVEEKCGIVIAPGTLIEKARFDGERSIKWNVGHSLFRNVEVSADLGGRFEANDSVFDDCIFRKRGGWVVHLWSSRWNFANCVFAKRFLSGRISVHDYSVSAIGCTFYDVSLPKFEYRDDPAKEAQSKYLRFKG